MRKKFDKGEPITNWTAEDYRDIVRRIEAAGKLTGAAPVRLQREKSARIMSIDHTQGFYATLSGSASPYSFTEKYGSTGGAWSTGVRTGTSNAYEVNGTASLNGKTVWLEPGYPGDYRFQYVANNSANWTITVEGCGGVVYSGVTVTVTHSGGSVSGTTNGSGIVTFTGLPTGSATATSTAPNARWVNTSVIKTLVSGSNTSTLSMSTASGYICLGCLDPASTTLFYSVYRQYDHVATCTPETLSGPLTFSGTADWSGEYLPPFATPPTTDGRVRMVLSGGALTIYLEELFGAVVTWSASATASVTCSPFVATATVTDSRWGCASSDITITITE